MTLQECYAAMGGSYEEAVERLHSDALVQKFILRFLDDRSLELFFTSVKEKDYEEAYRAVHSIKGVSQNLGFTRLLESCSEMCKELRSGWTPEACALTGRLESDYRATKDAIERFQTEYGG